LSRRLPLYGERAPAAAGAPDAYDSELRLFDTSRGAHLFVVEGSRIFDLDPESAQQVESLKRTQGDHAALSAALFPRRPEAPAAGLMPLYSISLNVAQACNMSCGYCYADEGKFGGSPRVMSAEVARASVDRLVAESGPRLLVGFMGGEPLLNREVVHEATRYAARRAADAGKQVSFSVTTNATLLRREDVELFASHPFSVQVSIDGARELNDAQRPMRDGSGSYERIEAALSLFERFGRPRHLAARVTVTPRSGELLPTLDHLVSLGFDEVGFAPVLVSPSPEYAFAADDFDRLLVRMEACGRKALGELLAGREYPFGNFITAMQEIHRGSHRPHPCGAGAGYLSANAEGQLFACHRLIDVPEFAMGSVGRGTNDEARSAHLRRSHVDLMEPCRGCWARYLCGGGCYHEVRSRGRVACDYIRGWLDFCLKSYVELTSGLADATLFGRDEPDALESLLW